MVDEIVTFEIEEDVAGIGFGQTSEAFRLKCFESQFLLFPARDL